MRRLAAVLAAAALPACAGASEPRWYVMVDNDVVFHTDRWYSSGVNIARVVPGAGHETEWGLIQEVYTPEGKHFAPGTVDRAPVGRLLFSAARHDAGEGLYQTLQLALGVRGRASLARGTTAIVHRLVPSPYVDWSREESTHADALASITRSHRLGGVALHYGAVAGNSRSFAHAGIQLGFGPAFYAPVMRYVPTPPPAAGPGSWSGFVGASVRAVAFDRLAERSYDALLPAPDAEHVVGRLAAGVGTVWRWGSAGFALAMDTREFEGQRRAHGFGSLVVHVEF